jgi:hypothetical protein
MKAHEIILKPNELFWSWRGGGGQLGGRRRSIHASRAESSSIQTMTVLHGPTGVCASGSTKDGFYSRKEQIALKQALKLELINQLKINIAKQLRLPGRSA